MKRSFILVISFVLLMTFYTIYPKINSNAETKKTYETGNTIALSLKHYKNYKNVNDSLEVRFLNIENKHSKIALNKNQDNIISKEEQSLLARLVHAEAKGEPYIGKVAVANVVLNRVEHEQFPDTVKEVIYEKNAFEPVQNDSIKKPADKEAYKAVTDALALKESDDESLYFYNPDTATSDWIRTRNVTKIIGNHAFAI
ncbi:cell wall hydrolase [Metabacillus litoralis]|uniref:cell wall hydrolase n=1 Tax=Metabacillus litoralis TaxID=152268 RepID=UPI0039AF4CFA